MKNLTVQQAVVQLVENAEKMSNDTTWFYRQDVYKEKISHVHRILPTLDCGCIAGFTMREELELACASTETVLDIMEDTYSTEVVSAIWPIFSETDVAGVVYIFSDTWERYGLDPDLGQELSERLEKALAGKQQRDHETVPFHEYGFGE